MMANDDLKLELEVTANTKGAVDEVTKLNRVLSDNLTAADAAGKGQKTLGQEVAITKARQVEAAEAIRRAKDAQAEHNLVVQAFGPKSREAADAAKKLSDANAEAQKTATAAAKALENVAKQATEAAQAEGDKLSPATKRAAAEIRTMGANAERAANDLNKVALSSKVAGERATKGGAGFDVMGFASSKLMGVLGPAALGGTLISLAGWLGEAAEKTLQYETAIANLPFSIDGARAATKGLVSDQMLVASAASASSLKVTKTAKDFEILASASVKLAAKLGQPADQLLNNLVTALGRGSTELLDNAGVVLKTAEAQERYAKSIGVSVSALTDEQKANAFRVEAMKAILKAADETTIAYDSNAASMVRWKTQVVDAWEAFSRAAANAVGAAFKTGLGLNDKGIGLFHDEDWIPRIVATATALDTSWSPAFTRGAESVGKFAADMLLAGDAYEVLAQAFNPAALAEMEAANKKEAEKRDILSEEAAYSERMAKAIAEAEKANKAFVEAAEAADMFVGPQEAPKAKKSGKKGKKIGPVDNQDRFMDASNTGIDSTNQISTAQYLESSTRGYEAELEVRQRRLDVIQEEMDLLEDEAEKTREYQDMVFYTVEVENEAETQRDELMRQRIDREMELAKWQAGAARDEETRIKAVARIEELTLQKRELKSAQFMKAEEKQLRQRQKTFEMLSGRVTELSGAMVDAVWQQAEGQKGAIAMALGDYLKGVSKEFSVRALGETAKGFAALAGIYTAGLAPGYFKSAAMSAGVAIAAGAAGASIGAAGQSAADAQKVAEEAKEKEAKDSDKELKELEKGGGKGEVSKREGKNLSAQTIPISYDERRRGDASRGPKGPETVILQLTISGPVIGAGGVKQVGRELQKMLDEAKSAGKLY